MDFAFHGTAWDLCMVRFDDALAAALEGAGNRRVQLSNRGARLVLAHVDPLEPKAYHRHDGSVVVVALLRQPRLPQDPEDFSRTWLLRSLANLAIVVTGPEDAPEIYVRSPDRFVERIAAPAWSPRLFGQIVERLRLLDVHLVIDNIFDRDLDPELAQGGEALPAMRRAARRLAETGALASGPPAGDFLSHQDRRHLERLYQGSRMSYGNLSVREDQQRFWMSTSGVDWMRMEVVGRDVELVKGYDAQNRALLVSVPPGVRPHRVSADALTHHLIYRTHPGIGAIVHLHAWLEGVRPLVPDYARGSLERAQAVARLVQVSEDPVHAVVGIDRHGLIVAGEDLEEILTRLAGAHVVPVPAGGAR